MIRQEVVCCHSVTAAIICVIDDTEMWVDTHGLDDSEWCESDHKPRTGCDQNAISRDPELSIVCHYGRLSLHSQVRLR